MNIIVSVISLVIFAFVILPILIAIAVCICSWIIDRFME